MALPVADELDPQDSPLRAELLRQGRRRRLVDLGDDIPLPPGAGGNGGDASGRASSIPALTPELMAVYNKAISEQPKGWFGRLLDAPGEMAREAYNTPGRAVKNALLGAGSGVSLGLTEFVPQLRPDEDSWWGTAGSMAGFIGPWNLAIKGAGKYLTSHIGKEIAAGAITGAGDTTIKSLAHRGEMPSMDEAASSALAGGVFGGVAPAVLRGIGRKIGLLKEPPAAATRAAGEAESAAAKAGEGPLVASQPEEPIAMPPATGPERGPGGGIIVPPPAESAEQIVRRVLKDGRIVLQDKNTGQSRIVDQQTRESLIHNEPVVQKPRTLRDVVEEQIAQPHEDTVSPEVRAWIENYKKGRQGGESAPAEAAGTPPSPKPPPMPPPTGEPPSPTGVPSGPRPPQRPAPMAEPIPVGEATPTPKPGRKGRGKKEIVPPQEVAPAPPPSETMENYPKITEEAPPSVGEPTQPYSAETSAAPMPPKERLGPPNPWSPEGQAQFRRPIPEGVQPNVRLGPPSPLSLEGIAQYGKAIHPRSAEELSPVRFGDTEPKPSVGGPYQPEPIRDKWVGEPTRSRTVQEIPPDLNRVALTPATEKPIFSVTPLARNLLARADQGQEIPKGYLVKAARENGIRLFGPNDPEDIIAGLRQKMYERLHPVAADWLTRYDLMKSGQEEIAPLVTGAINRTDLTPFTAAGGSRLDLIEQMSLRNRIAKAYGVPGASDAKLASELKKIARSPYEPRPVEYPDLDALNARRAQPIVNAEGVEVQPPSPPLTSRPSGPQAPEMKYIDETGNPTGGPADKVIEQMEALEDVKKTSGKQQQMAEKRARNQKQMYEEARAEIPELYPPAPKSADATTQMDIVNRARAREGLPPMPDTADTSTIPWSNKALANRAGGPKPAKAGRAAAAPQQPAQALIDQLAEVLKKQRAIKGGIDLPEGPKASPQGSVEPERGGTPGTPSNPENATTAGTAGSGGAPPVQPRVAAPIDVAAPDPRTVGFWKTIASDVGNWFMSRFNLPDRRLRATLGGNEYSENIWRQAMKAGDVNEQLVHKWTTIGNRIFQDTTPEIENKVRDALLAYQGKPGIEGYLRSIATSPQEADTMITLTKKMNQISDFTRNLLVHYGHISPEQNMLNYVPYVRSSVKVKGDLMFEVNGEYVPVASFVNPRVRTMMEHTRKSDAIPERLKTMSLREILDTQLKMVARVISMDEQLIHGGIPSGTMLKSSPGDLIQDLTHPYVQTPTLLGKNKWDGETWIAKQLPLVPDSRKQDVAFLINDMIGLPRGTASIPNIQQAVRAIRWYEFVSKIGGSLASPVVNVTQNLMSLARMKSVDAWMRGMEMAVTDSPVFRSPGNEVIGAKQFAQELGASGDYFAQDLLSYGAPKSFWERAGEYAGWLFNKSEQFNQHATTIGGYLDNYPGWQEFLKRGEALPYNREAAQLARDLNNQINKFGGRANTPMAFRTPVGGLVGQFKPFQIGYMGFMKDIVTEAAHGNLAPFAKFTLGVSLLGGPQMIFTKDGVEAFDNYFGTSVQKFPNLLGAIGVNLSNQVGLGALPFSDYFTGGGLQSLFWFLPGPAVSTILDAASAATYIASGAWNGDPERGYNFAKWGKSMTPDDAASALIRGFPVGGIQLDRTRKWLKSFQTGGEERASYDLMEAFGIRPATGEFIRQGQDPLSTKGLMMNVFQPQERSEQIQQRADIRELTFDYKDTTRRWQAAMAAGRDDIADAIKSRWESKYPDLPLVSSPSGARAANMLQTMTAVDRAMLHAPSLVRQFEMSRQD